MATTRTIYAGKRRRLRGGGSAEATPKQPEPASVSNKESTAAANGEDAEADGAKDRPRRLNPIKQKQMEDRCAFLEEEVPRIEAAIAHTEEQLGVYVSAAETQRLTTLAEELREQLTALTAEWEELMMQLDGQAALG